MHESFIREEIKNKNRQELPVYYRLNGTICLAYYNYIKEQKSFFREKTFSCIMLKERSVHIDDEIDLN